MFEAIAIVIIVRNCFRSATAGDVRQVKIQMHYNIDQVNLFLLLIRIICLVLYIFAYISFFAESTSMNETKKLGQTHANDTTKIASGVTLQQEGPTYSTSSTSGTGSPCA